jgi:hypothetical protein
MAHRRGLGEDLVHDVGAGGDHRAQLVTVDNLGRPQAGVPGQPGDLLDGPPRFGHDGDGRMHQLPRRPASRPSRSPMASDLWS